MSIESWAIYLATVLVLMSTPGPSQLLMLSNSATHGFKRSIATAAGDLTANLLQMLAAGLGLAAALRASGEALLIVKWLGVAYLIWLGIRMILKSRAPVTGPPKSARASLRALWLQGFITSASNPKAIVFFAALFPQFISVDKPFWIQFAILSGSYIVLDGLFLLAYGAGANFIAARFKGTARAWIERLGGGLIIGAAILLGLKKLKESS